MDPKVKGLLWLGVIAAAAALVVPAVPRFARHLPWSAERWLAGVLGGTPASSSGDCACSSRPWYT